MAAIATQQQQQLILWRELEEDDRGNLGFLQPWNVIKLDQQVLRKTVEYRDTKVNKADVTTTTSHQQLECAPVSGSAMEPRSWPKFGGAVKDDDGTRLTRVCTEEIPFEHPRSPSRC